MTVKGIERSARKAAAAAKRAPEMADHGDGWNIEMAEGGGLEIVRQRTPREERQHEARMARWVRQAYDRGDL